MYDPPWSTPEYGYKRWSEMFLIFMFWEKIDLLKKNLHVGVEDRLKIP